MSVKVKEGYRHAKSERPLSDCIRERKKIKKKVNTSILCLILSVQTFNLFGKELSEKVQHALLLSKAPINYLKIRSRSAKQV